MGNEGVSEKMTYKPGGNNRKSIMRKRIDAAIAVLETAYINGNGVYVEDSVTGETITIDHDAIPYIRECLK